MAVYDDKWKPIVPKAVGTAVGKPVPVPASPFTVPKPLLNQANERGAAISQMGLPVEQATALYDQQTNRIPSLAQTHFGLPQGQTLVPNVPKPPQVVAPQIGMPKVPAAAETQPKPITPSYVPPTRSDLMQVQSKGQLAQDIQSQIARQIQERLRISDRTKGSLNTQFERMKGLQTDERNLQNTQFERLNNPFSGGTDYRKAMLERERNITDRQQAEDLATRLANVDMDYADFVNSAPDRQRELLNEAVRRERDYGLAYDTQQFGQFDVNRRFGLQEQEFDWNRSPQNPAFQNQLITSQINQLKLQNLPQEIQLSLGKLEQDVMKGDLDLQSAQYQLQQLQDPQSPLNRKMAIETELAEIDLKNYPREQQLKLQEIQKRMDQIGKEPPKTPQQQRLEELKVEQAELELQEMKDPESISNQYKQAKTANLQSQVENRGTSQNKPDAKASTDLYFDAVGKLKAKKGITQADANAYAEAVKDALSDSDYRKIKDWINENIRK